jgi:hypothetical protein
MERFGDYAGEWWSFLRYRWMDGMLMVVFDRVWDGSIMRCMSRSRISCYSSEYTSLTYQWVLMNGRRPLNYQPPTQ